MYVRFKNWIEDRAGLSGALRAFLHEPIPKSTGWRNTLGGVAGALLLVQILTGFSLALYYVPHPEAAYETVEFIEQEVTAGALMRALHYWGASFMLVALVFHALRVVVSGAYRKPRELNWLSGLGLLGLAMALAFTGQLLPWNQEGYWAAKVGVEIGASSPIVGPIVEKLLLGGQTVGALTLSRFYALHVILLPLLMGVLVIFHLYLLRRHAPMRAARDRTESNVPFFPLQLARDLVSITLVVGVLILVAWVWGSPESAPANPADRSHVPRPEWYFMAHFQLLRLMPGSMKILATFAIPAVVFGLLALLPWLDRSQNASWRKRPLIIVPTAIGATSLLVLTLLGFRGGAEGQSEAAIDFDTYDIVQAGQLIYEDQECLRCHIIDGVGMAVGPNLSDVGLRLREDFLRKWIVNPKAFKPKTEMPGADVTPQEFDALIAYLLSRRTIPENP